jgi:hypothetical protein
VRDWVIMMALLAAGAAAGRYAAARLSDELTK